MTAFAAVLLAGGQSRRMGRDKALLPLPDGRLLWERQLAILRELEPAELFISGPAREGFPPDVTVLCDETPCLGPLGGITAALGTMRSSWLVVLAVDMPMMTAACLATLWQACEGKRGIVPRHQVSGFYEPLAAVYPRECLPMARARLHGSDRSLQSFVQAAASLVEAWTISAESEGLFANWNEPEPKPG